MLLCDIVQLLKCFLISKPRYQATHHHYLFGRIYANGLNRSQIGGLLGTGSEFQYWCWTPLNKSMVMIWVAVRRKCYIIGSRMTGQPHGRHLLMLLNAWEDTWLWCRVFVRIASKKVFIYCWVIKQFICCISIYKYACTIKNVGFTCLDKWLQEYTSPKECNKLYLDSFCKSHFQGDPSWRQGGVGGAPHSA